MHRTISVNYNVVVEGTVELILDSGETRIMRPRDMVVQRAINHSRKNTSQTDWARITAVAFATEPAKTERDQHPKVNHLK